MHTSDSIGQLFMVGIPGSTLTREIRARLLDLRPGGVILFRRNYVDPEQLTALCQELHALLPAQLPLIALDHEGGRVHRLTSPFTHFPPAALVARTRSAAFAQRVGHAMGAELSSVGVAIDFAPVLDVLTNVDNTVIGDRAFASDPRTVGLFGCALARGLRAGGVIPCGKHFPGHGATHVDSHEDLPRDERTLEDLMQTDLPPFRSAMAEGIEMLMTAHIVYPAIDPEYPATLSQKVIEGLLRQQLGYRGVVVTDDLEMGAIIQHDSVEHAAVQALRAGADLLLICHQIDLALAAREACVQALEKGTLSRARVEAALQRVATLQQTQARQPRAGREVVGAIAHQQLAEAIIRAAAEKA